MKYHINDEKFNDTLGLDYVAKENETRKFKGIEVVESSKLTELEEQAQALVSALKYYPKYCRACNSHYGSHEEGFKNDNLHGCDCLVARHAIEAYEAWKIGREK